MLRFFKSRKNLSKYIEEADKLKESILKLHIKRGDNVIFLDEKIENYKDIEKKLLDAIKIRDLGIRYFQKLLVIFESMKSSESVHYDLTDSHWNKFLDEVESWASFVSKMLECYQEENKILNNIKSLLNLGNEKEIKNLISAYRTIMLRTSSEMIEEFWKTANYFNIRVKNLRSK